MEAGVLIKMEAEALKTYKGNKHKLLYSWSIIALKRIMQTNVPKGEKGNPMLQSEHEQTALVTNLKQEIVELRGALGKIDNSMLFPIPFQYYHIVNVVLTMHLILMAYAFLQVSSSKDPTYSGGNIFSLIVYPIVVFTLIGLKEVANAMADPFGTDECDFNQQAMVDGIYRECKRLCEEPEEEFLSSIGDPSFNPTRNADGTLSEAVEADDDEEEEVVVKEVMWAMSDVQVILDEKHSLEEQVRREGIATLTNAVQALVSHQREMDSAANARLDRLEQMLGGQLSKLAAELRGDAYDMRYVGQDDDAGGGVGGPTVGTGRLFPDGGGGSGGR
ncbi:hypothetical protein T484DRAFT_1880715, partial [Baffinella frigidus]